MQRNFHLGLGRFPAGTFRKEPLLVHDTDRFADILPVGVSTRNDKQYRCQNKGNLFHLGKEIGVIRKTFAGFCGKEGCW